MNHYSIEIEPMRASFKAKHDGYAAAAALRRVALIARLLARGERRDRGGQLPDARVVAKVTTRELGTEKVVAYVDERGRIRGVDPEARQ